MQRISLNTESKTNMSMQQLTHFDTYPGGKTGADKTQPTMLRINPLFCTQSMSVETENLIIRARHTALEWLDLPLPREEISRYAGLSPQEVLSLFKEEYAELQDGDATEESPEDKANRNWANLKGHIDIGLARLRHAQIIPGSDINLNELLDGVFLLLHWSQKCEGIADYYHLARTCYMLFTRKSPSERMMQWLFPSPELQGFEEVVGALRQIMDFGKDVTDSKLVKQFRKLYMFMLVQGVLGRMGFDVSEKEFETLHTKAKASVKYQSKTGFLVHVVDMAIFACERAVAYRKTGSIDSFFREGKECEEWLTTTDRILALAPFTANLEAHNTTYFRFLSDLNDAIDKGQAYARSFRAMGTDKTNPISRKLGQLMMLKNAEVTKRSAQRSRAAPLGVLIYGHSGVAKSSFTRVLYHAYGAIFGLDRDDHYLYTRSPADEYWTNFDSSMWAIQMDDIAFLKPSASNDVDPTLKELLNVVNNVPYTPAQAALEDKGKTPVLAKLVLATTNCEDLNATHYFHCPLAVRRRLPYVLEVTPKKQYMQPNGVFIEPKSLPAAEPGFPDFWDIKVKKLVPAIQPDKQENATLELVAEFSDIKEFIKHFGAYAKEHLTNQSKGEAAEAFVKQVELCPLCCSYKEDCACELQFGFYGSATLGRWFTRFYVSCLTWCLTFSWYHRLCSWLATARLTRWLTKKFIIAWLPAEQFVRFMTAAHQVVHDRRMEIMLTMLGLLATGLSIYASTQRAEVKKQTRRAETAELVVEQLIRDEHEGYEVEEGSRKTVTIPNLTAQGNVLGTTEDDLMKEETSNVWYRDTVELQTFDLPLASASLVGRQPEEIRDMFSRNMATIAIKALDGPARGNTRGFFYRGSTLVMNAHPLKGNTFELTILRGKRESGVLPIITITVKKSDFVIDSTRDLAVLYVASMAPARDISKFWSERIFPVDKLVGIGRNKAGECDHRTVHSVSLMHMPLQGLEGEYPVFVGRNSSETRGGDCGTLYLAQTPRGYAFVGMHVAGFETQAGVMRILKSELDALCEQVQPAISVISGEGAPMLSLQDDPVLLEPHAKSVFRYLEAGSVEQFGRLPGFLPKPTSKVVSTPLRDVMEKYYGEPSGYTRPAMDGWEPIRLNVQEMVVPVVNYDRDVLDQCKRAFLDEIIEGLPTGWEGSLVVLSDVAAVNGLPGVKYVDKINTNSSMGFPWNGSKKKYLTSAPSEKHPEGVDFPPESEVWDHVRKVESEYAAGRRVYPIFMGHLKDEPVTHAKRKAKKTRLFAGGPIHWSLAVRKTLLSFVKLVQDNKLTFEAGPGTVCQSIEWQELRVFLTQFGLERVVAGDYSKFDKRMIADFIMAAYWIIAELHKRAGHDDDMYRTIMGIGTDTAYPVMNIRGELVMFYGTNPSGHPLTVIINSLVNGLYMRYSFAVLGYDVKRFKKFVALMTYGDDNAMGVSRVTPRFNHTAIQRVLEKIGVVYTMADKESESVAYIHIDDVAFLKRKWRFDEEVGAYVCPLDEDSIKKSLMVWLPSSTLSPEAQTIAVFQSAVNEYFWYGREVFEEKRAFLMKCASQEPLSFYVKDSTFPTWQELYNRFWGLKC